MGVAVGNEGIYLMLINVEFDPRRESQAPCVRLINKNDVEGCVGIDVFVS